MTLPTISLILKQYVNNHLIQLPIPGALVDSGSEKSLISSKSLDLSAFSRENIDPISLENAANNHISNISQAITVNIVVEGNNVEFPLRRLLLVPEKLSYPCIIGYDVLMGLNLKFPLNLSTVQFNNYIFQPSPADVITLQQTNGRSNSNTISTTNYNYYDRPNYFVSSKTDHILCPFEHKSITLDWHPKDPNLKMIDISTLVVPTNPVKNAGVLLADEFSINSMSIKVVNTTPNVVFIEANDKIATENPQSKTISELNTLITYDQLKPEDKVFHDQELLDWRKRREDLIKTIPIDSDLETAVKNAPIKHQETFRKILKDFHQIFSRSDSDIGLSKHFIVDLQLKTTEKPFPKFARPYKTDAKLSLDMDRKINDMIQAGVLEESISCWNSPCMLIKRTGGKFRLITNYKSHVNPQLSVPKWPVLPIRDLLHRLGQDVQSLQRSFPDEKIFFFSTDLKQGFYTLAITNSSRDITSFIASERQIRYKRCTQGMNTSPACFSRFVYHIFSNFECKGAKLAVYLDDSILTVVESYIDIALRLYLERIQRNQVTLGLQKCLWFQTKIRYLGHEISADGIKPCPKKQLALINMPYPTNHKEALRYAGSMIFYSRLHPKVALLLKPLYTEIKNGKKFQLNNFIKAGIDQLRKYLNVDTLSPHIDYGTTNNKVIIYVADSSLIGVGYAAGNAYKIGDHFHGITLSAYGSRSFDQRVQLLSSRSRELIGYSYGLEDFSDILYPGLEIYGFIDHSSLERCETNQSLGKTSTNTRVRKAMGIILNHPNLKICFVPNDNPLIEVVDGISRSLSTSGNITGFQLSEYISPKLPSLSLNTIYHTKQPRIEIMDLLREQQASPILKPILRELNINPSQTVVQGKKRYILAANGLVKQLTEDNVGLIYIPERIGFELCNYLHQISCHAGREKLKSMIYTAKILIPQKTRILQQISQGCLYCQFQNKRIDQPKMDYKIRPTFAPFIEVSIDLVDIQGMNTKFKYILTFFCKFSRFLATRLLSSKSSDLVTKNLIVLIHQHQLQQKAHIQCDNGTEFCSKTLQQTLQCLGISCSQITPYNSRGSAVERCHSTLRHILRTLPISDSDIRTRVDLATTTYNTSPQQGLDYKSPYSIVYGTPERNYLAYMQDMDNTKTFSQLPDEERMNHISKWYYFLQQHHKTSAEIKFERYVNVIDKNEDVFHKDDLVLAFDPIISLGKTEGTQGKGPFRILRRHLSAFEMVHCITGARSIRNRRFLRKLKLQPDLQKALLSSEFQIFNSNEIRLPSKDLKIPTSVPIIIEDDLADSNLDQTLNKPNTATASKPSAMTESKPMPTKNQPTRNPPTQPPEGQEPLPPTQPQVSHSNTPIYTQVAEPQPHYSLRRREKISYK